MATRTWTGSTSGSFTDAGNWDGAAPVDGDSIIFPSSPTQACNADLAQTALHLVLIYIQEGATYDVGTSGTSLTISATTVIHEGSGTLYYASEDDGTDDTQLFIVNSINRVLAASLSGNEWQGGTEVLSRIQVLKGAVVLESGIASLTNTILEIGYDTNPSSDAIVTVETNGSLTIPKIVQQGGILACNAAVDFGVQMGGKWTQDDALLATLYMSGNPTHIANHTAMTTAYIVGGVLDATQTSEEKTFTTVKVWPGARFLRDTNLVTVTNEQLLGSGFAGSSSPFGGGSGIGGI